MLKKCIPFCCVFVFFAIGVLLSFPLCASQHTEKAPPSKERLSNLYSLHFLRLLQICYGSEDIISQGGAESVNDMFSGIDLEGKTVLDVGCGFGGMDTYLAQKYSVNIIGVDKEPYMIAQAEEYKMKWISSLKGQVSFQNMNDATSLIEFPDNSFDIVCAKEMLYHVPKEQKQGYISEMYRVLKPSGKLVIADWICSEHTGVRLKNAVRVEKMCHFVTSQTFQNMLMSAGYKDISYRDVTKEHIEFSLVSIERTKLAENQIREELGEGVYEACLNSWGLWVDAMLEPSELLSGIFVATK